MCKFAVEQGLSGFGIRHKEPHLWQLEPCKFAADIRQLVVDMQAAVPADSFLRPVPTLFDVLIYSNTTLSGRVSVNEKASRLDAKSCLLGPFCMGWVK